MCGMHIFQVTRIPRGKRSRNTPNKPLQVNNPGQIVLVDQLVSPTPGLVAQMNGILTSKKYNYATVFVDHFYRYSYMHLQNTASSEETLERKYAFERISSSSGIIIKQYHAENVIFRANAWIQDCQYRANPQLTTYVGVDVHHTNGLREGNIKDIQDSGTAMILHAQNKWL